ncbi:MAG: hypothetical protein JNL13_06065 [Chitinophagaceae bacterium]|nr:hypothetical protein [Chitinophagaceae bacterium]
MSSKKIIISGLVSLLASGAAAQQKPVATDTTIKASTIEITQIYRPQVKQAVKETYSPSLPAADQAPANFTYTVPLQSVNYTYKPLPLQALAIGEDTVNTGYRHYIKAGLGNRRTLYLDAGLGNLRTKNFSSNIHLGILSQKGELAYQKQTIAALAAEGLYSKDGFKALMGLEATHNNFFQYGYDEKLYPSKTATRQTLSGAAFSLNLSKENKANGLTPEADVKISLYTGNNISNENTGALGLSLTKKLPEDDWQIKAGVEGVSTHLNSEFYSVSNSYASLRLGAQYDDGKLSFRAYLLPTIGQNSNTFLLHDIQAALHFDKAQTNIGAGLKGSLTQNTYRQLFLTNPYISQFPSVQTHSNEIYGFIEKGLGHHITLNGRLSFWQYENLATFLNQPAPAFEKMQVYYIPRVSAISTQLGLRYQVGNTISFGAQLVLFNYYNHNYFPANMKRRVWHTPNTRMNGDFTWNPFPELSLSAYGAYVGSSYALDSAQNEVKLKGFVDLGFGAEYLAMKKLSFFLNFNNLLNNHYQRWLGYQAYGINIYGGVRLKF